jgi:prolyl 4-hydroxylase
LKDYRTALTESMNMTLTVLSCAPRVFEIKHFLSDVEVDHFMDLAGVMDLEESSVSGSTDDIKVSQNRLRSSTRTSTNTWVGRNASPIIDTVYRRAADLLHIDEKLFRSRNLDEYPNISSTRSSAEPLQLVHYLPGQEYNAHHDFVYPKTMDRFQPARFATILLYLNEGMEGGETSFPRWVNAETAKGLTVKPEKGKAVLFYSFLPDGNLDDLSQHAALPVLKGEKWLTNLWIWDPHSSV